MSQFPGGSCWIASPATTSPPLFPFLLKDWTALFGASLAAQRSLSTVCAAVTMLGVYLFTVEPWAHGASPETHAKAGLLAAALSAVSPLQAYWGAQLRM